ncbi:galactose oxidase [Gigaspora margarita]|uniref:Galactose oxidase n=1 Tax=Gigaspora margarita TaxID=4874 RepID=A0A8H4B194_GIGMA|nr:galactose oxidase [Gigaspora margarita]
MMLQRVVWTNVTSGGNEPTKRDNFSCTKYNNRFIAIFNGDNNFRIPNDLWIFDSLESTWSLTNASNAPQNIYGYCAVTLPDETILYIGGTFRDILKGVPMNKLSLYNPASNTWKSLNTSGPTPPSRLGFSAVLTSGKHIIIYGGVSEDIDVNVFGDLWNLDIETYQWSVGNISNPNDPTLKGHIATLVDNYMIVAFGKKIWLF